MAAPSKELIELVTASVQLGTVIAPLVTIVIARNIRRRGSRGRSGQQK